MMEAVQLAFKNYVNFQGRARPSHFWWYFLFIVICGIVCMFLDGALGLTSHTSSYAQSGYSASASYSSGIGPIYGLFALATFLPSLAVQFRRLHDTDRSAWWILIALIPFVGGIVLIVFLAQSGTVGPNKFGPDPKGPSDTLSGVFS